MDLSMSGLASGMDWKSIVSQLADVERAPQKKLQTDQNKILQRNNAYSSIKTELSILSDRINVLKEAGIYGNRGTESSDTSIATSTAASGAPLGSYSFDITQVAKAASMRGSVGISGKLSADGQASSVVLGGGGFGVSLKAGTFTINGKQLTVSTSDTLQSVFDQIASKTGGVVTASYDSSGDTISLSTTDGSKIVLGSAADTSNFLQAAQLSNNDSALVTSGKPLGGINVSRSLSSANFAAPISDGGAGAGDFQINGVSIKYRASDTVSDVLTRINNSSAGVAASFDSSNNQFVLINKTTGDVGISLQDITGNFLQGAGLTTGTLQRGQNLLYTVNGGGQLSSQSNTITGESSGLTGLSVTGLTEGTVVIDVTSDTTAIKEAIDNFVTQYNKVQAIIDANTTSSTDASGKVTAGVLAGESDSSDIAKSLRNLTYNPALGGSGAIKSLDDLGIATSGMDNNLTVADDYEKLTQALTNNLSLVQDLFTNSTSGLAVKLSSYMDHTIGDEGTLVAKQSNLTKQSANITTQIADLERIVKANSDRLTDQFIAMETAQQKMKSQLEYLNQTFNSNNSNSSK